MRIFMTGGKGFVGSMLTDTFCREGHRVTILTRTVRPDAQPERGVTLIEGDPTRTGPWQEKVPGHDVIVNLAGEPVFKRWSKAARERIRSSRIDTTRHLVDALPAASEGVLLLSTSAVGYYGFKGDEALDETGPPGDDFLASVCTAWEAAAKEAEKKGARVVLCRFGIIMGQGGGALEKMVPIFRKGMGSPLGSGKQWISWIHEQDMAGIFTFLLHHPDLSGPVNCTAPQPVTNKAMTRILGKVLNRPTALPAVPAFVVRSLMGKSSSLYLKGQKVLPAKLLEAGFSFRFTELDTALRDLDL